MKKKKKAHPTFPCERCRQEFKSMDGAPLQASGCASTATKRGQKWSIFCGYGSGYDLTCFSVTSAAFLRSSKENVEICDECIEEGLHTGEVIFDKNVDFSSLIL